MPTKKYKQKLLKHRACVISRIVACISFLVLTLIGVSSLVRAMSLESVANQGGIPSSWQVASLGSPETITVPITYWDQRQDDCSDPDRQFEWTECRLYAKGIIPNIVKDHLGSDGLPIPSYTNTADSWKAYHDVFTANVTGNDPVKTTDNFYRWFHEAYDQNGKQLSKRIDGREVTFTRVAGTTNSYTYGSHGVFPIDDVDFSKDDAASKDHNFHFTAHMQIPMKISADGTEKFYFNGDDDVWVFLNGKLVLDLGGLHMATDGSFMIDQNGNVQATVDNVNVDQACRQQVANPTRVGYDVYNSQLENKCKRQPKTTTINTGFKAGDVVNLDFFYAERSTTESNTTITITNMNWPISADSDVTGKIVGKFEDTESNLVEYTTYVKNRDPQSPLTLERMSSYINDRSQATNSEGGTEKFENTGFLPLNLDTLYYTTTPADENSWTPVNISQPMNSTDGFKLATPLTMNPAGQAGDTLYFRFFAQTSEYSGSIQNITAYYTSLNGAAGVTYDHNTLAYTGKTEINKDPVEEDPDYNVDISYRIDFGEETPDPDIKTPASIHQVKKNGETYNVPSPDIPGFTPSKKVVEGTVDGADVKVEVVYTRTPQPQPDKYPVVIHYVKKDGSEAFPDYRTEHTDGDEFDIPSPELEGYTKDRDTVHIKVSGQPIEEYVYYTPIIKEHRLTIRYVYEDGTPVRDNYENTYPENQKYSVTSPTLEDYTSDKPVVSGTMGAEDVVITVTYKKIVKHNLTIHYVYENGSPVRDDYKASYPENTPYTVTSPVIKNYHPDQTTVSGKMGTSDVEITVTYKKDSTPTTPSNPVDPSEPVNPDPTPNPNPNPNPDPEPTPTPDPNPDTPIEPIIPDLPNDEVPVIPSTPTDTDDDLTFVPPLGEVTYVPNTGVISELIAPLFEEYFAEVILSQGFVLAMLVIFAGSFATFFSLRQYLHFAMATNTASVPQMPKRTRTTSKTTTHSKKSSNNQAKSSSTRKTSARSKTTKTSKK